MEGITDLSEVDSGLVNRLIDCSIQAYHSFAGRSAAVCQQDRVVPPEGYELLDSWTGVDAVFGRDKTVETYGLLFRSVAPPWAYIFAFRGTDSLMDMLDDLGVESQALAPFDCKVDIPADVAVEAGFHDVYRTDDGATASMQQQLFDLVDRYQISGKPIHRLYVTGHSLGAALSQLFTLDLGLSRPDIPVTNINFASPRVGNAAFVDLYEQHAAGTTLRVRNTHDVVPDVPPEELGFCHVQAVYRVAFYSSGLLGRLNLLSCHSSLNYRAAVAWAMQGGCAKAQLHVTGAKTALCCEMPVSESQHRFRAPRPACG